MVRWFRVLRIVTDERRKDDELVLPLRTFLELQTRLNLSLCNVLCEYFFKICCYLPCPPCPAYVIPKWTFRPPTKVTYTFNRTKNQLLNNKTIVYELSTVPRYQNVSYRPSKLVPIEQETNIEAYYIEPLQHTERLACYYMKWFNKNSSRTARFVVLRCHANATTLGLDVNFNSYLSWRLSCDVFEFDYCGYGCSGGRANESSFRKDVVEAYKFLINELNVNPSNVIVFGQSLGTVAAIHLASSGVQLAGLILDGVLMSAFRYVCPDLRRDLPCDQLESVNKISLIKCPTLVIHGGYDSVTSFEHAEYFMELCETLVPPLVIPDCYHCDGHRYKSYWNRLEIFFAYELDGRYATRYYQFCSLTCEEIHKEVIPDDEEIARMIESGSLKNEEDLTKHVGLSYPFV